MSLCSVVYDHYYFVGSCNCLSDALNSQIVRGPGDRSAVDAVKFNDYVDIIVTTEAKAKAEDFPPGFYDAIFNASTSNSTTFYKWYTYSSNNQVPFLPLNITYKFQMLIFYSISHNFTRHVVVLKYDCLIGSSFYEGIFSFFFDMDSIVTNLIIKAFKNRYGTVFERVERYSWWIDAKKYKTVYEDRAFDSSKDEWQKILWIIWHKTLLIIQAVVIYAIASVTFAIIIRMLLLTTAALFVLLCILPYSEFY